MKEHNTGRLRAYLDGALTPDEHRSMDAHLDECAECRSELDDLRLCSAGATDRLSLLDPAEREIPDVEAALQQFHAVAGAHVPVNVAEGSPSCKRGDQIRSFGKDKDAPGIAPVGLPSASESTESVLLRSGISLQGSFAPQMVQEEISSSSFCRVSGRKKKIKAAARTGKTAITETACPTPPSGTARRPTIVGANTIPNLPTVLFVHAAALALMCVGKSSAIYVEQSVRYAVLKKVTKTSATPICELGAWKPHTVLAPPSRKKRIAVGRRPQTSMSLPATKNPVSPNPYETATAVLTADTVHPRSSTANLVQKVNTGV